MSGQERHIPQSTHTIHGKIGAMCCEIQYHPIVW